VDADRGAAARASARARGAGEGSRALEGRTIVVTRAAAQAQRFTQLLEAAGARVIEAPAIVIAPPASWELLDAALSALSTFTWLVFTSVNGVSMVDRRPLLMRCANTAWASTSYRPNIAPKASSSGCAGSSVSVTACSCLARRRRATSS